LPKLLQSQQWELAYYRIDYPTHIYYATEYQYRIQFRPDNTIAVFKQSGDVAYGIWNIVDDTILNITMQTQHAITGKWELIEHYVRGYDQDRIRFKNNNLEIGLY
jgi:hypothetical protein